MPSAAYAKYVEMMKGARILAAFSGVASPVCPEQSIIDQVCRKAAVANAVGCWEGYVEAVVREFVSKVRGQAHRRAWTLIAQYESVVDKMAADLNTPSWDKARELIYSVTGMDPYASWIWRRKYSNQNDTKQFFDGVMKVRHAFAHGFIIPSDIAGVATAGKLDAVYVDDVQECINFFAERTDFILEHELTHRHNCTTGWS